MIVFTSGVLKVKLLLNAVKNCCYIVLQNSVQGVASKCTMGFLLLPTMTTEAIAFSFDFLCVQYSFCRQAKLNNGISLFKCYSLFFLLSLIVSRNPKNSHWKRYKKGEN